MSVVPVMVIFVWNGERSFRFSVIYFTVWEKFQAILDFWILACSRTRWFELLEERRTELSFMLLPFLDLTDLIYF